MRIINLRWKKRLSRALGLAVLAGSALAARGTAQSLQGAAGRIGPQLAANGGSMAASTSIISLRGAVGESVISGGASVGGARSANGFFSVITAAPSGATAQSSAIEAPSSVVFDEISAGAITASAYARSPAFTGLGQGSSGIAIAIGPSAANLAYAPDPWHLSGNAWRSRASMPTARFAPAAATVGGLLYVMGGQTGSYLPANEAYDPVSNAWTPKAAMPTPRSFAGAAAVGGKVYVMGGAGVGGDNRTTNEEYDAAANIWISKTPMPTGRSQLTAAAVGGKVYALGGSGPGINANEEYNPATNNWAPKAPLPTPRGDLASAALGGRIYVVGGYSAGYAILNVNEEYNPANDSWNTGKAPMPTPRIALAAAALGGKIYAMGGTQDLGGSSSVNANEEYDPTANQWATRTAMTTPRYLPGAGAVLGRIYVAGGNTPATTNVNEEYDPGVATTFSGLAPNTEYFFKAKARDASGAATAESPVFSIRTLAGPLCAYPGAGSNNFTFTDILIPRQTVIRAAHVNELRGAINALRADAGLSAYAWSEPLTITPNSTLIRAAYFTEMRGALNDVYDTCNQPPPAYSDAAIIPGITTVRTVNITDLRSAVLNAK